MEKIFVTFRFQPQNLSNLRYVIEYLEKCESELKQDEDMEVVFVCNVNEATINIGTAKLKPTELFNAIEPYEVIPQNNITLYGVCDLLDNDKKFKRLFPPPNQRR